MASGKDQYQIELIDTSIVCAHGPNYAVQLILNDVALVPGHFTNIILISKLASQNVPMDPGDSLLYVKENSQRQNYG